MRHLLLLAVLAALVAPVGAVDLYNTAATAQSVGLGNQFENSQAGPTDSLAMNPAGLSYLGSSTLEVSGMGVLASGTFHNSTPYIGTLGSTAGFSGSAAFGARLGDSRISIGFGTFPVSLISDRWRYLDPPGGAGRTSYGYQSEKSALIAVQSSAAVSVRFTRWMSVGGALGILCNANTLETPYVFQENTYLRGLKTLLDLHTSGIGYNGTFGAIFNPDRKFDLGVAYKTRTTVRSTGTASGNASNQFATLGLPFQPTFRYRAEVDNTFPQSVSTSLGWQALPRLRAHVQVDWINWRNAFENLPVHLTQGNNPDINSLLGSSTLNDGVPLKWKNQIGARVGVQLALTESTTLMGGYSYTTDPVPASTLTPLTADIMKNALSTGLIYQRIRYKVQLAYQVNLPTSASVQQSSLASGEYDNTRTSLWLQTIVLTTGIRF